METLIALHSVAHRVSHQIPAESEMSRQNRATPPQISRSTVAPFSGPPCRTKSFLSFAAGRGPRGGVAAGWWRVSRHLLGSENGSRYRGVSQLQSTPIALLCATKFSLRARSQSQSQRNQGDTQEPLAYTRKLPAYSYVLELVSL